MGQLKVKNLKQVGAGAPQLGGGKYIYKEKTCQNQKEFTRAVCISTECTMAAIEFISGVWSVLGSRYTNLN